MGIITKKPQLVAEVFFVSWLPRRDSNPNKQNQNLRCYHYTTRQSPLFRIGGVDGARTRNPRIDSPVR